MFIECMSGYKSSRAPRLLRHETEVGDECLSSSPAPHLRPLKLFQVEYWVLLLGEMFERPQIRSLSETVASAADIDPFLTSLSHPYILFLR